MQESAEAVCGEGLFPFIEVEWWGSGKRGTLVLMEITPTSVCA
jgi:hypothetical protein